MTAVDAPPAEPDRSADAASLTAGILDEEARRHRSAAPPATVLPDDLLPGSGARTDLRSVLRKHGVVTLATLSIVALLDQLGLIAFQILGPDIQETLGLSDTGLGAVNSVGSLTFVVAAVPLGFIADRTRRTRLAAACAVVAAAFSGVVGAAGAIWVLVVGKIGVGAGQSAILPVHNALLADRYPAEARSRVLALHNIAYGAAALLGPLFAGGVTVLAGGGPSAWRWVFVALTVPGLIAGLAVLRVPEPERGRHERAALVGDEAAALVPPPLPISFSMASQRLLKIQTLRFLLVGIGVFGFTLAAVPTFFNVMLERRYGLDAFDRGVVGSLTQAGGLLGVPVGAIVGDRLFRSSPPRAILLVAASLATYGIVLPVSLHLPGLVPVVIGVAIATACVQAASVPIYSFVASVAPYRLRGLAFALIGIYIFLMGGFLGGVLTGVLSDAWGPRTALTLLVPPASLVAAALVAYGARFVRRDLSIVVEELREEQEELRRVVTDPGADGGSAVPMLQVRGLDASYGPVQVLFGVDLDVHRGEVLALLGTNGAGKSTVLKAISGLLTPDRGTVRLGGRNITYVDAERRARLGLVHVSGGQAVFPSLTVAENLRVGAHTFIWDLERVEARVDRVLELFPILLERVEQEAGTLSGGEQQMLGLAKALLLEPEVLLIDELSLGLAPVVVQELLGVVESLKAAGVTMVIVEQSINVALTIADRAVFMEKGSVRFEGQARDLLARDDLVRAVFLGAGEGG